MRTFVEWRWLNYVTSAIHVLTHLSFSIYKRVRVALFTLASNSSIPDSQISQSILYLNPRNKFRGWKSYSVCSPGRILSVSKKRREATLSFADPHIKASGFHGPKPAEVYGFVGSITTVVSTVILLVWAYVPESWLHWIGIFYYPSRYWALAVPANAMMTVVLALVFYCGLSFMMSLVGILQGLVK